MRLTEEQKRNLFSHARDDAEKQRLLAAFRSDPKADAVHGLFELLAAYALIVFAACFASVVVDRVVHLALPTSELHTGWYFAGLFLVFVLVVIAINMSFDGVTGAGRRRLLDVVAHRYGYPIVLAAGVVLGAMFHSYLAL
jgi:hypothetical protein